MMLRQHGTAHLTIEVGHVNVPRPAGSEPTKEPNDIPCAPRESAEMLRRERAGARAEPGCKDSG